MNNNEVTLKWKPVGDRWIAYVIEGDARQGRYEVGENKEGWECVWMFDGGDNLVAKSAAATFEQAKQVAERHWETGAWADMTHAETHSAFFGRR
jgi:hypothetical protein